MTRLLVVMGSGETAPTMVKPHRSVFERVEGPAALLDTPYGFQSNADDISQRAVGYFAASVGRPVATPAGSSPVRAARPTRCGSGAARRCPTCWPTSSPAAESYCSRVPPR
jgi:hypothetical protein